MAKTKKIKKGYPLKLDEELMDKAVASSVKEDISFNQWLRNAVKAALNIK